MGFDPISAALDIGGKLIDRLWPDPAQRDAAKLEMLKMQQSGALAELTADTDMAKAQMAINAAEASNKSIFVAGWRPYIGWIGGSVLAFNYVIAPLLSWATALAGKPIPIPTLDFAAMSPIVTTLLGVGAMRSYDKKNGTDAGH